MTTTPNGSSDLDPYVADVVKGRIYVTRGATTSSMARRLSVSRAALSNRTNGRVAFTPGELDAIAAELGTTASELLREAERRRRYDAANDAARRVEVGVLNGHPGIPAAMVAGGAR